MNIEDENEIIRRVQTGDKEAYAILIDQYKQSVFNLVYRMIGSYDDADDISQEIFLRVYVSVGRFDTQKRFFPWLYTISLNLIRNYLKKKKDILYKDVEGELAISSQHITAEQMIVSKQDIEHLNACLLKLPVQIREAIVLRYYQDLSFELISQILGTSVSTSKMRVYRGLRRLKKLMAEG